MMAARRRTPAAETEVDIAVRIAQIRTRHVPRDSSQNSFVSANHHNSGVLQLCLGRTNYRGRE